ncbi:hypothetical protein Tco_0092102 [Tanacetum coccineum]
MPCNHSTGLLIQQRPGVPIRYGRKIAEECKYDIAAMYGISHWWVQRQRFYIDRFSSEGDRRAALQGQSSLEIDTVCFNDQRGLMKYTRLSDGTSANRLMKALDYPRQGIPSKDFMFAIQKRLKTRRIFRNLESFVGGEGFEKATTGYCREPNEG